jgi:PAS domain-containing protein
MHDGAATVSEPGIVLYANRRLAQLLGRPLVQVIGAAIGSFIADAGHDIRVPADGTFEADLISGAARGAAEPQVRGWDSLSHRSVSMSAALVRSTIGSASCS